MCAMAADVMSFGDDPPWVVLITLALVVFVLVTKYLP